MLVFGNRIQRNTTNNKGDAICDAGSCDLVVSNNNISENSAKLGGAIYLINGISSSLNMAGNRVRENSASVDGGAAYSTGNVMLQLSSNIFERNSASENGGGIFIQEDAGLFSSNNTMAGNYAQQGGAIYCSRGAVMEKIRPSSPGRTRGARRDRP